MHSWKYFTNIISINKHNNALRWLLPLSLSLWIWGIKALTRMTSQRKGRQNSNVQFDPSLQTSLSRYSIPFVWFTDFLSSQRQNDECALVPLAGADEAPHSIGKRAQGNQCPGGRWTKLSPRQQMKPGGRFTSPSADPEDWCHFLCLGGCHSDAFGRVVALGTEALTVGKSLPPEDAVS